MREELRSERLQKLKKMQDAGIAPYPISAKRTHTIGDARKKFGALARAKKKLFLVGRVMGVRDQGGVLFLDLRDQSGQIQAVLKKDTLPNFDLIQSVIDRGDFLSVGGVLFKTKKGEESIDAKECTMLAKSLLPLPTEWFGLENEEARLRERYVDLVMHPDTRTVFEKKAIFWNTLRAFLVKEGFLEVETPVLESTPGGAEAEPFVTHHNALGEDFYLRISLELPLKKLLVGGFEKVFEIGRIFRNEGMSREHLQDYTQLEFYWAYADYVAMMDLTEKMYKEVIKKTKGSSKTVWNGTTIDWGKKWEKVGYVEIFKKENKIDPLVASREELDGYARSLGIKPEPFAGKGRLIDLIYKKTVRPKLLAPCFLIDPPVEIEPLAKRSPKDPRRVERFQIVGCGTELGKGFSELNDPIDQRARFEEQMNLRAAGDKEAHMLDEDYLNALEYGMPPAAGFGMSERLFAILMDKSVRETTLFPLLKTKGK